HGWLHIVSDLGVWSAYVAIPAVLGYVLLRRKDLRFRPILVLFGVFILVCGATHLMEALLFWWPAYRLAGAIKLLAAIVSWGAVLALVPSTPKALALDGPTDLELEVQERKGAEARLLQSEERFRALVEGTTDYSIFMLDPKGTVVSWNAGAERSSGYRAHEIIGQPVTRFFTPEDARAGAPEAALEKAARLGR